MRIISRRRLREFWEGHADAQDPLELWYETVSNAEWTTSNDVRSTYGSADFVQVGSGETVIVFNIKGNDYRLVAKAKYKWGVAYALRVLTHAEYGQDKWKDEL